MNKIIEKLDNIDATVYNNSNKDLSNKDNISQECHRFHTNVKKEIEILKNAIFIPEDEDLEDEYEEDEDEEDEE